MGKGPESHTEEDDKHSRLSTKLIQTHGQNRLVAAEEGRGWTGSLG